MSVIRRAITIVFLLIVSCVGDDASAGYAPQTVQRQTQGAIERCALVKISTVNNRVTVLQTTDLGAILTGIAQQASPGTGSTISVLELWGVQSCVVSDGTTTITAGDLIDRSDTVDGRVQKTASSPIPNPNTICVAVTDAVAVAGTIFQCR